MNLGTFVNILRRKITNIMNLLKVSKPLFLNIANMQANRKYCKYADQFECFDVVVSKTLNSRKCNGNFVTAHCT